MKTSVKILTLVAWCFLVASACQKTELYEYPVTVLDNAEISSMTLAQNGENKVVRSSIDSKAATITLTVRTATDLTRLAPRANVADGSTVSPLMGVYNDFSGPVTYTVTSGNRQVQKSWTIVVVTE